MRITIRSLLRAPALTWPAILVLALGIGCATALYALVYAMWLAPLPYPESHRLVSVTTNFPAYKVDALVSPDYGTWQDTRTLGDLAAYSISTGALARPEETIAITHARVSASLLPVLAVTPAAGRAFTSADDTPQAPPTVILTHQLWRAQFASDRNVIGTVVPVDGTPHTVVGVLPPSFRMPNQQRVDLLIPLAMEPALLRHGAGGRMRILRGLARLQPQSTIEQAQAELATKLDASRRAEPKFYQNDVSLRIIPLKEYVVGDSKTTAIVLLGAVSLVLLIACGNVAGLLVARAAARAKEMSIRQAIGAQRWDIARLLISEGLLLAAAGAAFGTGVAVLLIRFIQQVRPAELPNAADLTLSPEVLLVSVLASTICAAAFSLAPLVPVSRLQLRRALVVAELALSLVLLSGALLLVQSLARLQSIAPGFRTEQLITANISLRGTKFDGRSAELVQELRQRLNRTPGTLSVAFADALPPEGAGRIVTFSRADRPLPEPFHRGDNVVIRLVDPSYFETMGISLRQGRGFDERDGLVAIVNQTLADRHFKDESPLGKNVDGLSKQWKTVVGIVADARNQGIQSPVQAEIYLPYSDRSKLQGGGVTQDRGLNMIVRTAADTATVQAAVRRHLRELDPALLARTAQMSDQWRGLTARPRFQTTALGGFSLLALLMAAAGVYGVIAHTVVLRRREMGIRLALGARPGHVRGLVIREALLLAIVGSAIGSLGWWASDRILQGLLYQIKPHDPGTLAAAVAVLLILSAAASAVPAIRASRENPARTLRAE